MSQPVHHLIDAMRLLPFGNCGPVDHEDRHAQITCGKDLGPRARPACVFRHHKVDAIFGEKRPVAVAHERSSINQNMSLRKPERVFRRINQPQQVEMLGIGGEGGQMHAPNGQHYAFGWSAKGSNRPVDIGHVMPVIASLCHPRRPGQSDQRRCGVRTGRNRIVAHLGGKRVRGVDHMGHGIVPDVGVQSLDPAKASDPCLDAIGRRAFHPTRQGHSGLVPGRANRFAQRTGFGGATENQEVWTHG